MAWSGALKEYWRPRFYVNSTGDERTIIKVGVARENRTIKLPRRVALLARGTGQQVEVVSYTSRDDDTDIRQDSVLTASYLVDRVDSYGPLLRLLFADGLCSQEDLNGVRSRRLQTADTNRQGVALLDALPLEEDLSADTLVPLFPSAKNGVSLLPFVVDINNGSAGSSTFALQPPPGVYFPTDANTFWSLNVDGCVCIRVHDTATEHYLGSQQWVRFDELTDREAIPVAFFAAWAARNRASRSATSSATSAEAFWAFVERSYESQGVDPGDFVFAAAAEGLASQEQEGSDMGILWELAHMHHLECGFDLPEVSSWARMCAEEAGENGEKEDE